MEWGREQPPAFTTCPVPRTGRGVAHAPVSVSLSLAEYSSDVRAVCTCIATALTLQRALQHQHESSCIAFARGAPMEFVERAEDIPEPISIARCREPQPADPAPWLATARACSDF